MAEFSISEQGFKHYAPIETDYGETVLISESSRADIAAIWLRIDPNEESELDEGVAAHLSFAQAIKVIETLAQAMSYHYQVLDQE